MNYHVHSYKNEQWNIRCKDLCFSTHRAPEKIWAGLCKLHKERKAIVYLVFHVTELELVFGTAGLGTSLKLLNFDLVFGTAGLGAALRGKGAAQQAAQQRRISPRRRYNNQTGIGKDQAQSSSSEGRPQATLFNEGANKQQKRSATDNPVS